MVYNLNGGGVVVLYIELTMIKRVVVSKLAFENGKGRRTELRERRRRVIWIASYANRLFTGDKGKLDSAFSTRHLRSAIDRSFEHVFTSSLRFSPHPRSLRFGGRGKRR